MNVKQKNLIEPIGTVDSQRYDEKLTVNGRRLPDPYYSIPSEIWVQDLSNLPDVTFPDMFMYCVHKIGQYTSQELKSMKSLESYNYHKNGFVQTIHTCSYHVSSEASSSQAEDEEFVFLKACVLPSQRVGKKTDPYVAWVLCRRTGEIMSGHCTCMAG